MRASSQWYFYQERLKEEMVKVGTTKPWLCPTIGATCYYRDRRHVGHEYKEIRASGFPVGITMGSEKDHINLIHQRYHLLQWEKANPNTKIEDIKTILEIGGGYGALAIVASSLGFVGDYHIVDLPVFEEYQRQHLDFRGVNCTMKWKKIERPDLMIAIASLCEIPVEARDRFLSSVRPRSYLFAYASYWDDVNNTEYFTDWSERQGLDSITYGDRHQLKYLISTEATQ